MLLRWIERSRSPFPPNDGKLRHVNESTAMARVVVERLLANGVTDVVLAPGSRSAPLALACAGAERQGLLELHIRIDERSAGFLALGIAKSSEVPVAVVCTSGSAVANLAPAVVEAAYAGVPLIVVTADRPPELRNVGANQTIDQVGFFGQQVRTAIDLIADSRNSTSSDSWRHLVDRVTRDAIGDEKCGGAPVHLNIGLREPLVPDDAIEYRYQVEAVAATTRNPVREPINYVVGDLGLAKVPARGLVVVGDVADPEISVHAIELAQACGWPLISEPSGNALAGTTAIPAASVLLANDAFRSAHEPDLVVTVGRFGLSRPIMKVVASAEHHVAIFTGGKDRPDPLRSAALMLNAVPRPPVGDAVIPFEAPDQEWLRDWISASDRAQRRVQDAATSADFTGLSVASVCWNAATADDAIFVAASRSVRNLEAVMTVRQFPPAVIGNRGTSGIDGLVSAAWGAAIARDRSSQAQRTIAILGDLAFLHDHNGLIAPTSEPKPNLTIVVADNNGGGIFSSLEQGAPEFSADFEQVFGTPHNRDLAAIAAATGHPTTVVTTAEELAAALEGQTGTKIVIARTADRIVEQDQWAAVLDQ